eukprot:scpid69496/ scgid12972/ 
MDGHIQETSSRTEQGVIQNGDENATSETYGEDHLLQCMQPVPHCQTLSEFFIHLTLQEERSAPPQLKNTHNDETNEAQHHHQIAPVGQKDEPFCTAFVRSRPDYDGNRKRSKDEVYDKQCDIRNKLQQRKHNKHRKCNTSVVTSRQQPFLLIFIMNRILVIG